MMRAELEPFVARTWCSAAASPAAVEHVLPTGAMHLVLRFAPSPLRLLARGGAWENAGFALVGGARSVYYARVVGGPSRSVGAMLRPGAARALFGVSSGELAERHTPLADLWGSDAEALRDEVAHARDPLATFEAALVRRLRTARARAPFTVDAALRIERIAELARRSGYSHRVFTEKFREEVGLAPKAFARVTRLQRAVALLATPRPLADVAFEAGYADQPHLCRDFRALAGVSPAAYRRIAPAAANHVAMGQVDFVQDATR